MITETDNRTMVLERVIAAPVRAVWAAWTDPGSLPQWWGPKGFSCETKSIDLGEGGEWVFDMTGPDGTVFPNRHRYRVWRPLERIEYTLDDPDRDRPHAEATVTFAPEGEATRITLTMVFVTPGEYQMAARHGAVELGYQTLDKLAAFVGAG